MISWVNVAVNADVSAVSFNVDWDKVTEAKKYILANIPAENREALKECITKYIPENMIPDNKRRSSL